METTGRRCRTLLAFAELELFDQSPTPRDCGASTLRSSATSTISPAICAVTTARASRSAVIDGKHLW
jgi:hypothetical protein